MVFDAGFYERVGKSFMLICGVEKLAAMAVEDGPRFLDTFAQSFLNEVSVC